MLISLIKGEKIDEAFPLLRSRTMDALDAFAKVFNHYSGAYDSSIYSVGVPFESSLRTMIVALEQWRESKR